MNSEDRRFPKRPILGVGALIVRGDEILLIERGREPLKGWWSLPGGVVESGELLEHAIRREVREETGLIVEPVLVVEIFERIMRDGEGRPEYHYVLVDYLCRLSGGELRPADDCAAAKWANRERLKNFRLTEGTLGVIEKTFRLYADG
jgi:ADP-ribose pyrophosphatase YjhB (NUDIX family)